MRKAKKQPPILHVDCMVRSVGHSMAPEILDGDVVFIEYTMPKDGQVAFVEVYGDITIKRIRYLPDGVRLESNNPDYPPLTFTGDMIQSLIIRGTMCGLIRAIP